MTLWNLLGRIVGAFIIGIAEGAITADQLAAALAQSKGSTKSRSGPAVVRLQRVPKEGARA